MTIEPISEESTESAESSGWFSSLYNSAYETVQTVYNHIRSLPTVAYELFSREKSYQVIKDLSHTAVYQVAPMVIAATVDSAIQSYCGVNGTQSYSLWGLRWGSYLLSSYWINRKRIEFVPKALALTINTADAMKDEVANRSDNLIAAADVCKDCSPERQLKGDARDNVVYFIQRLSTEGVRMWVPVMGPYMAKAMNISLNGQFALGLRLGNSGMCDTHRNIYYRQHNWYVLSLGAAQDLFIEGVIALARGFNIPLDVARAPLNVLAGVGLATLLHRLPLPEPVSKTNRTTLDLALIERDALEQIGKIMLPGIEKRIAALFSGSDEPVSIIEIVDEHHDRIKTKWWYQALNFVLPPLITNPQATMQDPVMKVTMQRLIYWAVNVIELVQGLAGIKLKHFKRSMLNLDILVGLERLGLMVAYKLPGFTGKVAKAATGTDEDIVKLAINLLNDPIFLQDLQEIKQRLLGFGRQRDLEIVDDVRGAVELYRTKKKGGDEGEKRASFYTHLFRAFDQHQDQNIASAAKMMVCLAIADNDQSSRLAKMVSNVVGLNTDNIAEVRTSFVVRIRDSLLEAWAIDKMLAPKERQRFQAILSKAIKAINDAANSSNPPLDIKKFSEHWLTEWLKQSKEGLEKKSKTVALIQASSPLAFWQQPPKETPKILQLSREDCQACFRAIEKYLQYLSNTPESEDREKVEEPSMLSLSGVFSMASSAYHQTVKYSKGGGGGQGAQRAKFYLALNNALKSDSAHYIPLRHLLIMIIFYNSKGSTMISQIKSAMSLDTGTSRVDYRKELMQSFLLRYYQHATAIERMQKKRELSRLADTVNVWANASLADSDIEDRVNTLLPQLQAQLGQDAEEAHIALTV